MSDKKLSIPKKIHTPPVGDDVRGTDYELLFVGDINVNYSFSSPREDGMGFMSLENWLSFAADSEREMLKHENIKSIYEKETRINILIKANNDLVNDRRRVQGELDRANIMIEVLVEKILSLRASDED